MHAHSDTHCMAQRCSLCRANLKEGDDIILAHDRRTRSPSVQLKYTINHPPASFPPSKLWLPCNGYCDNHVVLHPVCHRACADWLPLNVDLVLLSKVSAALSQPDDVAARERRLLRATEANLRLTGTFSTSMAARIPPELRTGIAKHLTRLYATILLGSLEHQIHGDGSVNFDMSKPFKVYYTRFEGQHYVRSIVNTPVADRGRGRDTRGPPRLLWISETCHGIRNIFVTRTAQPPPASVMPGVWWKLLLVNIDAPDVSLHSDGFKVRTLVHASQSTDDCICWPVPRLILTRMRTAPWSLHDKSPAMMKAFAYNHKGITGISVCCRPEPCALHIHDGKSANDFSFYDMTEVPDNAVWIYIPLTDKERISAIWWRIPRNIQMEFGLAFVIDNIDDGIRRVELAGMEGAQSLDGPHNWSPADVCPRTPNALFYDNRPGVMREIMFATEEPPFVHPQLNPIPVNRGLPVPLMIALDSFQSTSAASLESVTTLQRCYSVSNSTRRPHVTGILFGYDNGTSAAVGQVRLDCLGRRVNVQHSTRLWLVEGRGLARNGAQSYPYIAEARLSSEEQKDCFRVDWSGTLEWWFSHRQAQVRQGGRTSTAVV